MKREPIAIVGIGCRFPGDARGPEDFWRLVRGGVDAISEIPPDRWSTAAHFDPVAGRIGKSITRWGGFVGDLAGFDPEFFGISPREAEFVDPQQRLLLECAWDALEDAGQIPGRLRGSPTGVFVGISTHDYEMIQSSPEDRNDVDIYSTTGGGVCIAANRVSYALDLRGPSLAVDTACSSSLIAVHLACRSLAAGDCDLALAGGVNALLAPLAFIAFSRMSMLSPTGRCRAFDASADGFVRAEGAGVVALKRLSDAQAAGDRIYCVLRATAANQDGKTNGITVPSAEAQAALGRFACAQAGVDPSAIAYAEAHGTGTPVGDPIEARALSEALGAGRSAAHPLVVGSVKTNVGHLEAGAGIAGLIKTALVLRHGEIPANLHFRRPNPSIDFERLKLRVPTAVEPLVSPDGEPALAAINSFGFGGSNAHAVLQAMPRPERTSVAVPGRARLLPISARTPEALRDAAAAHAAFLRGERDLDAVCATAATRRTHHAERLAVVGKSGEEMAARLETFAAGDAAAGIVTGKPALDPSTRPVFVFSGQGTQWWGMGRELLVEEPVFRRTIEAVDRALAGLASWRLLDELARDEASSRLAETAIAQPAIFALQVGLAELWKSWGVEPSAVVGHSVGEVAAAHVSGALELAEAARVIFHRGRTMDLAPERGRMLAASLTPEDARAAIGARAARVEVGAVNGPASVTLSGDGRALEEISAELEARGVFCRFLQVQYAFHSPQMDPVREELLRALGKVDAREARLPFFSTVTGTELEGDALDAGYWWRNVRQTVRFADGIAAAASRGARAFLELGAHPALAAAIGETLRAASLSGTIVASLRRKEPERATLLEAAGKLHAAGLALDWRALGAEGGPTTLPGYPWQKEPFWHEAPGSRERRLDPAPHPFLGRDLKTAEPSWETWLDRRAMPWLDDHRVQGHVVFPAAGYLEVALEAAERRLGPGPCVLEDVDFLRALVLPDGEDVPRLQVATRAEDSSFTLASGAAGAAASWMLHASGKARPLAEEPERIDLAAIRTRLGEKLAAETCYRRFQEVGLTFGPAFRGLATIVRRDGEALARLATTAPIAGEIERFRVHPALLDACFQALSAAIPDAGASGAPLHLPVHVERVRWFARPTGELWSHAVLARRSGNFIVGDLRLVDAAGEVVIAVDGFRCQAVPRARAASETFESWIYDTTWVPRPLAGVPSPAARPTFLPKLARIASATRDELRGRQAGKSPRARFLELEPEIDRLCRGYVQDALARLGWKLSPGAVAAPEALAEKLGVVPAQRKLFRRLLALLGEDRVLRRSGENGSERWKVARKPAAIDVDELWGSLFARFPALHPELTLLRRTGSRLAEILRGDVDPLAVIAPGGSLAALEHFYQDAPSAVDYDRAVGAAVAAALEKLPEGRRARLLEIGGGTGGMTAHVLPRLPKDRFEYVFTDVSPAFFAPAEQKFFEARGFACRLLDVERSPADQGFEPHSFDVILASDALHATASLAESLASVTDLLAPGGLLVLLEIDRPTRWVDLVFGTTPGWWRFRDHEIRPEHPLLDRAGWRSVLLEHGFAEVVDVPDVLRPERSGQTIFLARRAGHEVPALLPPPEDAARETIAAWLLLADRGGTAETLAGHLAEDGARVALAFAGDAFRTLADGRFEVRAGDDADLHAVAATLGSGPVGLVHLWSLDFPRVDETTLATLAASEAKGCHALLAVLRVAAGGDGRPAIDPARLAIVTRGSAAVGADRVEPAQAPLAGLARVVRNEHRRLRCRTIDLDPAGEKGEVAELASELLRGDAEEEVARRGGARFANRLVRTSVERLGAPSAEKPTYRLEIPAAGALSNLKLLARPRRRPGPGEVEIEVGAAALNFRDVMKALGIYPIESDRDLALGDECAGRVTAVGRGVSGFRVGDRVLAMDAGCFASHVTVDAAVVMPLPPGLFDEEAVTIPVTFLTAWYALHHLGRIRAGESVLVHAATGGVGLSAIQVARLAGAEIFATAGSPEKRDLLRALGVEHVMDSRTLSFAEEIRAATGGRGVDLVLNSLAGEAIGKSLEALAPHGRFLEIGKRDIYQGTRVGLRPFRSGLSFFAIDLQQVMRDHRELTRGLVADFLRLFAERKLRPLPHRIFPMSEVGAAFRLMAKAQHVGKIVVSTAGDRVFPESPERTMTTRLRPEATYLVTGGLGGFGLAVAEWMVGRGARHLVLAGRSGAATKEAKRAVTRLRKLGAEIVVAKLDVADETRVQALFRRFGKELPRLAGVVHGAMVLDDGLSAELDAERFHRAMRPKVHGAWNLHRATEKAKLDFFVLFSSVSAIVGAPAQGNYVAANAFLDALAHHRRRRGLPALAIDWGGLAEVGYVAKHQAVEDHLSRQGIVGIPTDEALRFLDAALAGHATQVGLVRVDWQRWAGFLPAVSSSPRFSEIFAGLSTEAPEASGSARDAILAAGPVERPALLVAHLRDQVARVLRTAAAKIDPARPLAELGVDSLMAFELVNQVESSFQVTLPPARLSGGVTIEKLATVLVELLASGPTVPSAPARAGEEAGASLLALRAEGSRAPLFCIHPAGGLGRIYEELTGALADDQPVYAIESRALEAGRPEHGSVAALADDYASRITGRQARGPYRLLGFSLGGILALATAKALEERGQEVEALLLVDSDLGLCQPGARSDEYVRRHVADMYATFAREVGIVRELDPAALAEEASELARRLAAGPLQAGSRTIAAWLEERGHLRDGRSAELVRRYFDLFDAHLALVEGFEAPIVAAPIRLWVGSAAANGGENGGSRLAESWRSRTRGGFAHEALPGSHYDLIYPPLVGRLAGRIESVLEPEAARPSPASRERAEEDARD